MSETKKRKASSSELPPAKEQKASDKEELACELESEEYFFESLHPIVKRRVAALEKLQEEIKVIQAQYSAELLKKYQQIKQPLLKKRSEIISGVYEPKKEDLPHNFPEPEEKEKKEIQRGIPEFWLQVLINSPLLVHLSEKDKEALKYLNDIKCIHSDENNFALEFVFAENPFFQDELLRRSFKFLEDEYGEKFLEESQGHKIKWKLHQEPKEKKDESESDEEEEDWRFFQIIQKDYSKKKRG